MRVRNYVVVIILKRLITVSAMFNLLTTVQYSHSTWFLDGGTLILVLFIIKCFNFALHGIRVLSKIKYPIASGGCASRPLLQNLGLASPFIELMSKIKLCPPTNTSSYSPEPNAQENGYKCFGSDKFYVLQRHCFNALHVMTAW